MDHAVVAVVERPEVQKWRSVSQGPRYELTARDPDVGNIWRLFVKRCIPLKKNRYYSSCMEYPHAFMGLDGFYLYIYTYKKVYVYIYIDG